MNKTDTHEPFYQRFIKERPEQAKSANTKHSKKSTSIGAKRNTVDSTHRGSNTSRNQAIASTGATCDFNLHKQKNSEHRTIQTVPATTVENLFADINAEAVELLNNFDDMIQSVMPLTPAKRAELPRQIRALSHGLTDDRSSRNSGYMNTPTAAAAYVRYYMWWNLVRLVRLFTGLTFALKDGDYAVDIGSGPLTVVCALWISHPELRTKKITWYCIDESSSIMATGEDIFMTLAARTENDPWKIVRIKGGPDSTVRNQAALVTCANMMNELFWDNAEQMEVQAKQQVTRLTNYCTKDAAVLVIEPGIPRSARFISLMRDSLMKKKYTIQSPCPHSGTCPMNGVKGGKWCHFVFPAEQAPVLLQKRSADAGIPKDRLALSFIYAVKQQAQQDDTSLKVRIASDPITLPGRMIGRYGCSCDGLMLLAFKNQETTPESGSLVTLPAVTDTTEIDVKSGAHIVNCTNKSQR